jgi:prevent-host-death family protein
MSTTVNILEAKTHLSKLVARAEKGEEIIVARAGKPVARIIPLDDQSEPRFGRHSELRPLAESDWFDPLPEDELALWE